MLEISRFRMGFNEAAINRSRKEVAMRNTADLIAYSFNEAAINRSRKDCVSACQESAMARFNEAAINRSRKET